MIQYCQLQRGFFVLQNCDRPAVKNCGMCGRFVCLEHLSQSSGNYACIDCFQRNNQRETYDSENDDWVYYFRNRYYSDYGYRPFGFGSRDYQSFAVREVDEDYDEDREDADFFDS